MAADAFFDDAVGVMQATNSGREKRRITDANRQGDADSIPLADYRQSISRQWGGQDY